jgi:hypothetical protein
LCTEKSKKGKAKGLKKRDQNEEQQKERMGAFVECNFLHA